VHTLKGASPLSSNWVGVRLPDGYHRRRVRLPDGYHRCRVRLPDDYHRRRIRLLDDYHRRSCAYTDPGFTYSYQFLHFT